MTTRPSDDHLIALLRRVALHMPTAAEMAAAGAPRTAPSRDDLDAAADALAAAPSLTWMERVERAAAAMWAVLHDKPFDAGSVAENNYRIDASVALRAGFPEYAPQQED